MSYRSCRLIMRAVPRPESLALGSAASIHSHGQTVRYKVARKKTEKGYSVSCPGLPGCWSQGSTEHKALENIAEAIAEHLAVSAELAQAGNAEVRKLEVAA